MSYLFYKWENWSLGKSSDLSKIKQQVLLLGLWTGSAWTLQSAPSRVSLEGYTAISSAISLCCYHQCGVHPMPGTGIRLSLLCPFYHWVTWDLVWVRHVPEAHGDKEVELGFKPRTVWLQAWLLHPPPYPAPAAATSQYSPIHMAIDMLPKDIRMVSLGVTEAECEKLCMLLLPLH